MKNLFKTERIRLAALTMQDMDMFARWSEDSEFFQSLDTDYAMPRTATYFRAEFQADTSSIKWGIRLLHSDIFIGYASFYNMEWNNQSAYLTIGLGESKYRNKGYGTEATKAVIRYAFDELNFNRVGLRVMSNNYGAIRCYEKVGFVHEGIVREGVLRNGEKYDLIYMGILQSEWRKLQ